MLSIVQRAAKFIKSGKKEKKEEGRRKDARSREEVEGKRDNEGKREVRREGREEESLRRVIMSFCFFDLRLEKWIKSIEKNFGKLSKFRINFGRQIVEEKKLLEHFYSSTLDQNNVFNDLYKGINKFKNIREKISDEESSSLLLRLLKKHKVLGQGLSSIDEDTKAPNEFDSDDEEIDEHEIKREVKGRKTIFESTKGTGRKEEGGRRDLGGKTDLRGGKEDGRRVEKRMRGGKKEEGAEWLDKLGEEEIKEGKSLLMYFHRLNIFSEKKMGKLKMRIWVDEKKILDKSIGFNTINFLNFYCQASLGSLSKVLCLEILQEETEEKVIRKEPEEKVICIGFIEIGFLLINNVSKVIIPLELLGGLIGNENLSGSELEMSLVIASEEKVFENASK